MYRQGLGDCFLISLPRTDGSSRPYYVMIDCGVILGTADPGTKMTAVVDNIVRRRRARSTSWSRRTSTGTTCPASSRQRTRSTSSRSARSGSAGPRMTRILSPQKLKAEKARALAALRLGLSQLQLAGNADEEAKELGGILEFFGAAKGASTGDALDDRQRQGRQAPILPAHRRSGGARGYGRAVLCPRSAA